MLYLLVGIGVLLLVYALAAQTAQLTARAVRLALFGALFIIAVAVVVFFAVSGRYGLAAPAGAFALWAMRAWLLARQIRAGARAGANAGDTPPRGSGARMSRAEAFDVLGLEEGASADDVEAAYKNLIVKNHPDQGGTDWLAARLNEARDVLLEP